MKDYEENVKQAGLDHSHLIELDNEPNNFRYITIWESRAAWEAVEELDAHKAMHKDRDPLLAESVKAMVGTVVI